MNTHPMKLVTVICEALAREPVKRLLMEEGAHGYTVFPVEGAGAQGVRVGDIEEFGNVQFEVIVPPAVSRRVLERLEQEFFPHHAMVAHEADVRVLRRDKF
jgi:nitrogen regulatory protein PII